MTAKLHLVEDPLFAGFYPVKDAARLLDHPNNRKIRAWLAGWKNNDPIIDRDFGDTDTVSFLDLMELRFVDFFRSHGVSMQTLRRASERLRQEWQTSHPFALKNAEYLTDRRSVFAQVAKENGDKVTYNAATGQHEMWETLEGVISRGVVFDPKTALAEQWRPRADFEDVIIDPKVAFGKPVVMKTQVPTIALYRLWRAERSFSAVADWFQLEDQQVRSAVEFELALAA